MAELIFVTNGAKKSGKTTTAFNLALCFSAIGRKTLLLDTERNGWVKGVLKASMEQTLELSPFLTYLNGDLNSKEALMNEYDIILVDVSDFNLNLFENQDLKNGRFIIPVEAEFYGLNSLKEFLKLIKGLGIEPELLVPVLFRNNSASSTRTVDLLNKNFGNMVFNTPIQRNYYLARQKDFFEFSQSKFTEKAASTYLNLANYLLENQK